MSQVRTTKAIGPALGALAGAGAPTGTNQRPPLFDDTIVDKTLPPASLAEAELTKLIENTFRRLDVALVDELAMFAAHPGIDGWEALTRWSSTQAMTRRHWTWRRAPPRTAREPSSGRPRRAPSAPAHLPPRWSTHRRGPAHGHRGQAARTRIVSSYAVILTCRRQWVVDQVCCVVDMSLTWRHRVGRQ
ncbi:MAG: hypothetical protein ACYC1D_18530, partial [Acidimicrobiales bacterium]